MVTVSYKLLIPLNAASLGMLGGSLIRKLLGIAACIAKKLRDIKKKHIDEEYTQLIRKCHNKIEAIQPVIQECEKLLASMDKFTQQARR